MTDLTARVFQEQGLEQADVAALFGVTGNLKPLLQNLWQHVELENATFPSARLDRLNDTPMEVSVPLSKLDFSPLSQAEFIEEVSRATVTLPEPWATQTSAAKLSVVDGQLELAWEHTNANMVMGEPPLLQLVMPAGQLIRLELRPREVVLDTRAYEVAEALRQVPEVEAAIARELAAGAHPANIQQLRDFVAGRKAAAEELRTRAELVGASYPTAYRKP